MTENNENIPASDDDTIIMPSITARAILLGVVLSVFFTWFSIYFKRNLAATQIPVMPYLLLFVILLGINPLMRVIKLKKLFSTAEVMTIFLMCFLSSMAAGYSGGLVNKFVCTSIRGFSTNGEWEVYVEPFIKDHILLSEKGRQEQAKKIREVHLERKACKAALDAAKQLDVQSKQISGLEDELKTLRSNTSADAHELKIKERQFKQQSKYLEFAEERWSRAQPEGVSQDVVLSTYQEKLEALRAQEDDLLKAYHESKDQLYEETTRFIKGLSDKERAVPGILYVPGEGWEGYYSRLLRVQHGRAALKEIIAAEAILKDAGSISPEVTKHLDSALAEMSIITDGTIALQRKADLEGVIKSTRTALNDTEAKLRGVRSERRFATMARIKELDKEIETLDDTVTKTKAKIKVLQDEIHHVVQPQVAAVQYAQATQETLQKIRESVGATPPPKPKGVHDDLQRLRPDFVSFDASLRRYLISDVNWTVWLKPFASAILLFVVSYIMIMTLNTLVYRQWAYNEKLCYPLAELPMIIVEGSEGNKNWVPHICKSGLFWVGVSISFGILTWNYLANKNIISGVGSIELMVKVNEYVAGTVFEGLSRVRFFIIFSVIGVSFLLPTRITFSLWAFYLFYIFEGLVLVWIGHLTNIYQYRRGGWGANYGSAQACGGVFVFALYTFYASKDYFLAFFRPNALSMLSPEELKSVRMNSALFMLSTLVMIILMVISLGANLFYAALFTFVYLAVSIVLSRMVAEGGILKTSTDFNAIMLIRYTVGMKHSWSAPSLLSPFFWLTGMVSASMAPMMANALHIRDKMNLSRRWFYFGTFATIMIAIAVGIVTRIILVYNNTLDHGVGGGMIWSSLMVPRGLAKGSYAVDNFGGRWWLLSGVVLMTFILWARRKWPWMIHPLGLLMISSSMIIGYWGSIILGWSFKVLVSKYGSRETYLRLRYLFIGLVIGELLSALFGFHNFSHGWNP